MGMRNLLSDHVGVHTEYFLSFSDSNQTKNFLRVLQNQIPDLLNIQWKQRCSMKTDGQIDMTKLIAALPSFAKTPKLQGEKN
jgi:hypothetical protein